MENIRHEWQGFPEGSKIYHAFTRESAQCRFFNGRHIRFLTMSVDVTLLPVTVTKLHTIYNQSKCITTKPIIKQSIVWPSSNFHYADLVRTIEFIDLYSLEQYAKYRTKMTELRIGPDHPIDCPIGYTRVQNCDLE